MKNILLLLAGFAVGIAASMLIPLTPPSSNVAVVLHQGIIETGISALDSLRDGDEATAKLMLASAVNSHIVMWEKLSSKDVKQKELSETWRRQMSVYNAESGLSLPNKRQVDGSKKEP